MRKLFTAFVLLSLSGFLAAQEPAEKSNLIPPTLISMPKPKLPAEAKKTGLGGTLRAIVTVDPNGNVLSVDRLGGPGWVCSNVLLEDVQALREAARSVALQAKFAPATRQGVAEAAPALIEIVFKGNPNNPMTALIAWTFSPKDPKSEVLSGGALNAKASHLPAPRYLRDGPPVYPAELVPVEVLIDENGDVFLVRLVRGSPRFVQAAVDAACEAKFPPTFVNEKAVKVTGIITYNFVR